jgi:HK97 family phage major capsid protein
MLTRVMALEIIPRAKGPLTKRVAGEDLPASAFAYVGDAKKRSTWALPIEFKDADRTKRHIRKAIAVFAENSSPATETAWKRAVAAAKAHGIELADEKDSKKSGEAELQRLAAETAARKAKGEAEPDPEDPNEDVEDEDERDADTFTMSFSSETPVQRWFGDEVLDHSSACVDMSRAADGMSYLVDHDTGDQVGIIENLRIEKKKLIGDVRFSRSARAQDIKRDVQDKIRKFTSIGYRVMDIELEREEGEGDAKKRTYRVTRWMPMEGSSVAVPADITVGAGRSADSDFPKEFVNSKGERLAFTPFKEVRSAAGDHKPQIPIEVKKMEPKKAAEIMRLCTVTHLTSAFAGDHARAAEFAAKLLERDGMTVEIASGEILGEIGKATNANGAVRTAAAEHSTEMLALNEKEQKSYNLCRGIMAVVHNGENKKSRVNCFELEVSEQIEKTWEGKRSEERGGLFVPFRLGVDPLKARAAAEYLQRAGIATVLSAGTATKGSELVFTEPMEFIQFLYNQMRLKELGANVVSGLTGNVAFPKQTGRAQGSWVGENPGTDVADSNATLAQVTGSPRTYQTSTGYTRQLLAQAPSANVDIDSLVRTDLARDAALAIDLAGINGLGSGSNQPLGILGTTGVQPYTVDADSGNGGVLQWSDITKMEELLEEANADQVGEPAWLTTPGIKSLLKRTPELVYTPPGASTTVNVTGTPIWAKGNEIDGLRARWSNQVPSNLTKGTSVGTCHAFILGVFSTLVNGLWGSGFELVVDPYRLKKQGIIELTTFILTDWINRYPVAFAVAKDVTKS